MMMVLSFWGNLKEGGKGERKCKGNLGHKIAASLLLSRVKGTWPERLLLKWIFFLNVKEASYMNLLDKIFECPHVKINSHLLQSNLYTCLFWHIYVKFFLQILISPLSPPTAPGRKNNTKSLRLMEKQNACMARSERARAE